MGPWSLAEEPPEYVKRELCLTEIAYYLAVNVVDEQTPEMTLLRRAGLEDWVPLQRIDALDQELLGAPPEKLRELWRRSGVFGRSVFATDDDVARLVTVLKILKPVVEMQQDVEPNDLGYAMQVATAIRYAGK